jgi:hypothetical protein
MIIRIISSLLSLLVILTAGCGETINSTWISQDITIDGDGDDWEGIPLQYQEDMKVVYGIANDDEVINFIIRFNDERLARLFSMRGFALWLNEEDSEDKQIGIHYRDDLMRDRFILEQSRHSRNSNDMNQQSSRSPKPKGIFKVAKNDSLTSIPLKDFPVFDAAADERDGIFCFEFSIPLTPESGAPYYLNLTGQIKIKAGLEIVGMSEEEKENLKAEMEEQRNSMKGENVGGRRGGSMRGGIEGGGRRGGGKRPQMPDMDGEEYWISVQLAKK